MSRRSVPLAFSTGFGALMVAMAAWPAGPVGYIPLGLSLAAVLAGVFVRPAAPLAVLLTTAAVGLSDPPVLFVAASGLCAAAYLVTRYSVGAGAAHLTVPTALCLVGFTLAGAAAAAAPLRLAWTPLLAPVLIAVILVLVALPLLDDGRGRGVSAPAADHGGDA